MTMDYDHASTQTQHSLVKLVSWQRWYKLEEILQRVNSGDDHAMPIFDDRTNIRLPKDHILHLACQHQAPPRVIELLVQRFPQSVSTAENKGRYPLHIACAKGLKPAVINFLIKSHPGCCGIQDSYGKSPLHYVCESYAYNFRTNPSNSYRCPDNSVHSVIELLLKEAPESSNVEDLYRMNAIEYAIDSDTPLDTIKMMQNASKETWRTAQRTNPGLRHEDLRPSMSSLGSSLTSFNFSSENLQRLASEEAKASSDIDRYPRSSNVARGFGAPEKKVQAARTA